MSNPYVGEIRMFAGNFAPNGWLFCQGQTLPIDEYDTLFNLIGTTYGGDGQSNFKLPDLASRLPIHQSAGNPLASSAGSEAVTISSVQMPSHRHALGASSSTAGTATSPSGNVWAPSSETPYSSTTTNPVLMSGAALPSAGGGQAHDNMPPYLAVNFIISLYGIYPSPY